MIIKYRFTDEERNTLEAEVSMDETPVGNCKLVRISSENEIKLHIVSFKLDDSFASAGYTIHSELAAVEDGTSFGRKGLPSLIGPDETAVPALFTLDGKEFAADTLVTDDITVSVAPDVGDEGPK